MSNKQDVEPESVET